MCCVVCTDTQHLQITTTERPAGCVLCAQIFNCFLPAVNLVRTSSWAKDNDDKSFSFDDSAILIKRGKLIHGGYCTVAVLFSGGRNGSAGVVCRNAHCVGLLGLGLIWVCCSALIASTGIAETTKAHTAC